MKACEVEIKLSTKTQGRERHHVSGAGDGSTLAIAMKRGIEALAGQIGDDWREGTEIAILVTVTKDRR